LGAGLKRAIGRELAGRGAARHNAGAMLARR